MVGKGRREVCRSRRELCALLSQSQYASNTSHLINHTKVETTGLYQKKWLFLGGARLRR